MSTHRGQNEARIVPLSYRAGRTLEVFIHQGNARPARAIVVSPSVNASLRVFRLVFAGPIGGVE